MRIELNRSKGPSTTSILWQISKFDDRIDDVISSFKTVKRETEKLPSGAINTTNALNSLNERINQELAKKANLADFKTKMYSFCELAYSIDRQVSVLVKQNKDEFYKLNPHLKPRFSLEDLKWLSPAWLIWDNRFKIDRAIKEIVNDAWEIISEYGDEILTAVIVVGAVAAGIALVIVSGAIAAAFLIAGCAAIGLGAGAGIAGFMSYSDDGDVEMSKVFKGMTLGAIGGAIFGTGLAGGAFLGGLAAKLTGAKAVIAFEASKFATGFGTSFGVDFIQQTVWDSNWKTEGYNPSGIEGYNLKDGIFSGLVSAGISMAFGSIFKYTPFSKLTQAATGKAHGFHDKLMSKGIKFINPTKAIETIGSIPENVISSAGESFVTQGIAIAEGKQEKFNVAKLAFDVMIGTTFDILGNALSFRTERFEITDGLTDSFRELNQSVPVDVLETPTNYFDSNIPGLERTAELKKIYNDPNVKISSKDLSSKTYLNESGLKNSLVKDINLTISANKNVYRVIVPDLDLSSIQIKAFTEAFEFAKSLNIDMVVTRMHCF